MRFNLGKRRIANEIGYWILENLWKNDETHKNNHSYVLDNSLTNMYAYNHKKPHSVQNLLYITFKRIKP